MENEEVKMNVKLTKVEEEIKFKLAVIVRKMNDPRIPEIISFTKVKISEDLAFAKVYVSILNYTNQNCDKNGAIDILNRASGYIRTKIANCIKLRKTPFFMFFLDDSADYAFKIEKLLSEV